MLTFTAAAQRQISGLIARSSTAVRGLRLKAQARSPFKIDYHLAFIAPGQEVAEVCDATDHAKGANPYYSSGGRA